MKGNGQGTAYQWKKLFSRGHYGSYGNKSHFNNTYHAAVTSNNPQPIIRREANRVSGAHGDMYFKRKLNPKSFDAYQYLIITWSSWNNRLHHDFDIYSSLSDAQNNRNPWRFCNYNDPGIAFPRDCGPSGARGGIWTSLTKGGIQDYRYSVYTAGTTTDCYRKNPKVDKKVRGVTKAVYKLNSGRTLTCTNDSNNWYGTPSTRTYNVPSGKFLEKIVQDNNGITTGIQTQDIK